MNVKLNNLSLHIVHDENKVSITVVNAMKRLQVVNDSRHLPPFAEHSLQSIVNEN